MIPEPLACRKAESPKKKNAEVGRVGARQLTKENRIRTKYATSLAVPQFINPAPVSSSPNPTNQLPVPTHPRNPPPNTPPQTHVPSTLSVHTSLASFMTPMRRQVVQRRLFGLWCSCGRGVWCVVDCLRAHCWSLSIEWMCRLPDV
jgi:hypothetical protein